MNKEIKRYTDKKPHRWFRQGSRLIQVTPEYKDADGVWIFLYEYIKNGRLTGGCIFGFTLYDDMTKITEQEWLNALSECQHKKI